MTYSARDIRFTTKGKTLYAIALGWPDDGKIVVKSLAKTVDATQNKIAKIELLGHKGKLKFTQTTDELVVELPDVKLSDLTCALRITGGNFKPAPEKKSSPMVTSDANGRLNFDAASAALHGTNLKLEAQGGKPDIGHWDDPSEWISWEARLAQSGTYQISATISAADGDCEFVVSVGAQDLSASVKRTSSWNEYSEVNLGFVKVGRAGELIVSVRPKDATSWKPINFNSLRLQLLRRVIE